MGYDSRLYIVEESNFMIPYLKRLHERQIIEGQKLHFCF